MGLGFYMTLAAVPLFYVSYNMANGSQGDFFDRQFQKYREGKKLGEDKDLLYQAAVSQAIVDRARLSSYPRETSGPDLKFPEMFNTGSPWNQAVGQGADMRQLEEHYRKVHAEAEEQRIERMKTSMFVPA